MMEQQLQLNTEKRKIVRGVDSIVPLKTCGINSPVLKRNYSEFDIQKLLYIKLKCRNRKCIIPNIWVGCGEADLMCLSSSNYMYEYEIKLNHQDFVRDFKDKVYKHKYLSGNIEGHGELKPSYFYYVCSSEIIKIEEVPSYAGLIYFYPYSIVKEAPKISKRKITLEEKNRIMRGCYYRMWNMMLKENKL